MNKNIVALGLSALLVLPLAACVGTSAASSGTASSSASQSQSSDFDADSFYVGQWRGSVAVTGTSVYGTTGGTEAMLDIFLNDDGSCEVKPLESHADLLSDGGTWEGTDSELTLHLSKGDVKLKVIDKATLEGTASDFDIADFDTITFDFFG